MNFNNFNNQMNPMFFNQMNFMQNNNIMNQMMNFQMINQNNLFNAQN